MKTISSEDAARMIPDGATVMVGGFMGVSTRSETNLQGEVR
ncbi:hypothetical protein LMG23992_04761 [Cupriavidus laharis]|uniref:Succinyl-CoA--3-ketoacid-CoA transferase n=1 Tax=Cupriavidus laharis TaxID=151654 RepID=A0ABM8XQD5_9BURK|nr:hypothetical protein LMG23992_04761 [Cupriavidus laharis]